MVLFNLESPDGEKDSANRAQSSLLELPRCSLSYVNQTTDLSDFTYFSGRTPAAYLLLESLFEREINQKLNSKIIRASR